MGEPSARDYVAIALVSCATILFQITVTRILSVVVWYHWAFLAVSLAMLGLAVPGVWFSFARDPLRYLRPALLMAGLTTPMAVSVVVQFGALLAPERVTRTLIVSLLTPLLCMGAAVCALLVKARRQAVNRMYGMDLVGACAGAAVAVPAMHLVPTPLIAASLGFLPLLALLLIGNAPWRTGAALGAAALTAMLHWGEPLQLVRSKNYDELEIGRIIEKWTPMARLTVFDNVISQRLEDVPFYWGRGANAPAITGDHYYLQQDGSNGTVISAFDGELDGLGYLFFDVTSVAYELRPERPVAIIGGGGGRDILTALVAGSASVDAIEINGDIVRLLGNQLGSYSGDLYNHPRVNPIVSEARSHLTRTDKTYGIIQISLIDSWAASAAGAFAFAESNLYTTEAFSLFWDRLDPDGVLSASRFVFELPRLLVLARSALVASRAAPSSHLAVLRSPEAEFGGGVATVLLSKAPLTSGDRQTLAEIASVRGFELLYPSGQGAEAELVAEIIESGPTRLARATGFRIEAPVDDRPYFFHTWSPFRRAPTSVSEAFGDFTLATNTEASGLLRRTMIAVIALTSVMFFLPFVLRLGGATVGRIAVPHLWLGSTFFGAIGAGFMFLENLMLQRFVLFLGHPSYSMTTILSSLLLGMGLGSMSAPRLPSRLLGRLLWATPAVLLLLSWGLPLLIAAAIGLVTPLRVLISVTLLVPLGSLLGLFLPTGMMHFGEAAKAWFWAVNGFFGVAAGVTSLAVSMEFGFMVVGQLGCALYLLAVLAWARQS